MALPSDQKPTLSPPGTRSQLPFILSAVMIVIYFGFILLVAFNKELMGRPIADGLSWGILLGALVIISAWLLTLIYVMSFKKTEGER